MKAFLFSDLHVNYRQLDNIKNYVKNEDISVIIFAGDFLNMGEPIGFARQFIQMIDGAEKPFLWVPGNNDFGRGYHLLNSRHKSLEGKVVEADDQRFTGVGGSPASWSGQYAGESLIDKRKIGGTIFVSHVPPPGMHNLIPKDCGPSPITFCHSRLDPESHHDVRVGIMKQVQDDRPMGRRFADAPIAHICGHIHQRFGCTHIGITKVIKLAPAELGFYAIMDLKDLSVQFKRFTENKVL